MVMGAAMTAVQVRQAIDYNRHRFHRSFAPVLLGKFGPHPSTTFDDPFVRSVADWQELNLGLNMGTGKVDPLTEATLGILLPQATRAVDAARQMLAAGNVLFDSWGNDLRDNNSDGSLDGADPSERSAEDGSHYGRTYSEFKTVAGSYVGGWDFARRTVQVASSQTIRGNFKYMVCADLISNAYHAAGVMAHTRSAGQILDNFRRIGYVWQRDQRYPSKYLPGDFICTYAPGHGGHAAIVVQDENTGGGSVAPMIIDLPGPSSQISDGTYNPAATNDIQLHRWPSFRISQLPVNCQYLGRLLHSKLHGH